MMVHCPLWRHLKNSKQATTTTTRTAAPPEITLVVLVNDRHKLCRVERHSWTVVHLTSYTSGRLSMPIKISNLHYSVSTTTRELRMHRNLLLQAAQQGATEAVVADGLCNASSSKNSIQTPHWFLWWNPLKSLLSVSGRWFLIGLKTEITNDNKRSNVSNRKERSAVVSVHFVDERSLST